ncbi:STAS domain-containing protein [Streptomyces sp. NPDC093094]|uniref:STAS domain-containing protein n=1 Tax=Streptomyces sp. NPDC093094 TaxID=3366026 RepID=UPI00381A6010
MTIPSEDSFDLAVSLDDAGDAHIRITGDLDWDTADDLTEAARACLTADPAPGRLRLDCARLTLCDSLGLASLLMIHRTAATTGTRLYLDNRPLPLRRLLDITGTGHLFAGPVDGPPSEEPGEPDGVDGAVRPALPPPASSYPVDL